MDGTCLTPPSAQCDRTTTGCFLRSNTSMSWMPSILRTESELTSSLALILHIQRIMARSLHQRRFIVSVVTAQVSKACSIALLTQAVYTRPQDVSGRCRLVSNGTSWRVTAANRKPSPPQRAFHPGNKTLRRPPASPRQSSPLPLVFCQ